MYPLIYYTATAEFGGSVSALQCMCSVDHFSHYTVVTLRAAYAERIQPSQSQARALLVLTHHVLWGGIGPGRECSPMARSPFGGRCRQTQQRAGWGGLEGGVAGR